MGNDTDVTVEASPSDWILVEAALAGVISQRMRELMASRPGSWERACIEDGLRPLERVSHLILEAVYPDTSEEDEGEDDPYQRADDLTLVEDHGYPLISVGERSRDMLRRNDPLWGAVYDAAHPEFKR